MVRKDGWEVLNAVPGPHVDHIGDAKDLSRFPDGEFSILYASHVLEHFDYVGELSRTLNEWYRVLRPDGKLYIAVPDMDILCRLFLDTRNLTLDDRFLVMKMMFGAHVDDYDFHYTGFNEDILGNFLRFAGFKALQRLKGFGLFEDTSTMAFKNIPLSLCVIAYKQSNP